MTNIPNQNPLRKVLTPTASLNLAMDYLAFNPTRYLFPIAAGKKFPPCVKDNLASNAFNDEASIRECVRKFGGVNWGLAHRKSNVLVVDVDVNGKPGQATYDDLDLDYGFPETEKTRSPTGGYHQIYDGPHIFAIGKYGFGEGIDSPNYTLIPGCVTKDGVYTNEGNAPTAKAPAWFYDKLGRAKEKKASASNAVIELDQETNVQWATLFCQQDAEPAIEGKGGDMQTVKVAMWLRDNGISEDLGYALMLEHYNPRCDPEWDGDELRTKVANGYRYANQSAAGARTGEADFKDEPFDVSSLKTEWTPEQIAKQVAERRAVGLQKTADRREIKRPTAEPETIGTLLNGWVYVGQQRRWVRERDAMMWDPQSFDDYFANLDVQDKSPATPIGKHLLRLKGSAGFRRYETFTYRPGLGRNVDGMLNMYTPSDIVAVKDDTPGFDAHMAYLFPDQADRDHVLNWLAWFVQNLDKKPKHALIIQGEHQGTGKSWIGDMMAEIIGRKNVKPVSQETFALNHNGWVLGAKLITCEEIRSLGNYANSKGSKALHDIITQQRITVDEKNMAPFTLEPFLAGVLAFTNSGGAIRPDDKDRRYLIVKTFAVPNSDAYYVKLFDILDDKVKLGAIKWQLENRDLKGYSGSARAPATAAKEAMALEASSDLENWMVDHAENKPLCYKLVNVDEIIAVLPDDLRQSGQRGTNAGLRGAITDILRRRFNGVKLKSPIRPDGRKGDGVRVWATGPNAKDIVEKGDLIAIWNAERGAAAAEAAETAADDFGVADSDDLDGQTLQ